MEALTTLMDSSGILAGSSTNLLLELIVKITLLLGVASLACAFLAKASASVRRTVWCCTFVVILLMPLLHAVLPSRPLPTLLPTTTELTAQDETTLQPPAIEQGKVQQSSGRRAIWNQFVPRQSDVPALPRRDQNTISGTSSRDARDAAVNGAIDATSWQSALLFSVIALWLAGSLYVLARTARDWSGALSLLRRAQAVHKQQAWAGLAAHDQSKLPNVFSSDEIATPIAVGLLNPAIIMPASYEQWTPAKRHAALLHELAHIKSADNLARLLVLLVCALYWFHPLVWFGLKKLKEEQEKSADNFVLRNGIGASSYAQDLLEIVQSIQGKDHNERVITTMGSYSFFPQRMRSILSSKQSRKHLTKTQAGITFFTLFCVAVSLSMYSTQPIAAETKTKTEDTKTVKQDSNVKMFQSMADKQAEALNNGDIDILMSFYDDDAVYINFDERHRGKRSIQHEFQNHIDGNARVEIKVDEADVDGDKATEIGTYKYYLGGNDELVLVGRYRNEWEKQKGKWLITRDQNYTPDFSAIGEYTGKVVGKSLETAMKALNKSLNQLHFNIDSRNFDWDNDFDFDFDFDNNYVSHSSTYSSSPLHAAVKNGNKDIVELLLKEGADVNAPGPYKMTPLHMAAKYGQLDIAELLLKNKADPNLKNSIGQTPLYIASKYGNTKLVKLLLKHGAQVNEAKKEK